MAGDYSADAAAQAFRRPTITTHITGARRLRGFTVRLQQSLEKSFAVSTTRDEAA
jgi:hypothetical protein